MVRVDWLDKVIGDVSIPRDRLVLLRKEEQLEARLAELLREAGRVQQKLKEVHAEKSQKAFLIVRTIMTKFVF